MKLVAPTKGAHTSTREKSILAGLLLSEYDSEGLKVLGFETFSEAFNAIGYALGSKPTSIKNYRDEFDPLFPNNPRRGWHKRELRAHLRAVYEKYGDLDVTAMSYLVKSFFQVDQVLTDEALIVEDTDLGGSSFAQRLVTGLAAERYFESNYSTLAQFNGLAMENTTRLGCGYDFRLWDEAHRDDFFAVEVKGLRERSGSVSMTPKEYKVAKSMADHFSLFVVRNFREKPYHDIYQDPIGSALRFKKIERTIVQ